MSAAVPPRPQHRRAPRTALQRFLGRPWVETILGEIDAAAIAIVERSLLAAQAAGFVRPLDARAVATLVVGGVEKLALAARRGDLPLDLERLAREATRLHAIGTLSERLKPE